MGNRMRIAFFDSHKFEREAFDRANAEFGHDLTYFEPRLEESTAVLAAGHPAVCAFVGDILNRRTLEKLRHQGVQLIALRSAGFNHVDLPAAGSLGLRVVRVPEYSPHAVAEHAVALVLTLNRQIHRAFARVRDGNFSLEGLVGFDLYGKTVGLVGVGRIGAAAARIFLGFGCTVIAHDLRPDPQLIDHGVRFAGVDDVLSQSDIVSLHVPLTPKTHHIINQRALSLMKPGAMLINTGRGALIDSRALIDSLKNGRIGSAGLDVYEEEEGVFFHDLSGQVIQDDILARLMTFPNVVITSHQAFLTREALHNIATTTLGNVTAFAAGERLVNEVGAMAP